MALLTVLVCFAGLAFLWVRWRKNGSRTGSKDKFEIAAEAFDGDVAGDLFETAPIGYLEIDRQGVVRRVNRSECKLRGLAESELLGAHSADLIPELERGRYREQIQRK